MDYIEKHPDKPWDWYNISSNPNITIEDIEKHFDKIIFAGLSHNKFLYDDIVCRKHINQCVREKYKLIYTSLYQVTNICQNVTILISTYCSYF
jgi:hypothetical protein